MRIHHTYKSKRWLTDIDTFTISGRKEYYSGFQKSVDQLTSPFNPDSDDVIRRKPHANPKS